MSWFWQKVDTLTPQPGISRLFSLLFLGILFSLYLLFPSTTQAAATLPPGFVEQEIARNMPSPTTMQFAPDGRLFVAQQGGQLRVIKDGQLLDTPFLTVSVDTYNERGLNGVAFDPNFDEEPYVYVYYTATTPTIHNRLSRFRANGDVAVPGSEEVLLDLPPVGNAGMHNAGALRFGADGKLYVAVGDNGTSTNAQSMNNLFGKILRLNKDGTTPTDNPFYNIATGQNRAIWALGLRNPFSFNFQPGTNRMFINDVGQATYEEINDGQAAANYGWPNTEGPVPAGSPFTGPLFYYTHQRTTGPFPDCAITGGTFYNPSTLNFPSSYEGKYFYADYCARWVRVFDPATGTSEPFAEGIWAPVDLKVGSDGALYYLDRGENGLVKKIVYTASQAPSISSHPQNQTASVGSSVTFTVAANGTAPLTYQWQRDGVDVPGATSPSYTVESVSAGDNGINFRAVVRNAHGSVTSNSTKLTVTNNQAPSVSILSPSGITYNAGDVIEFEGAATDPEDGELPAEAFTWTINFHHDDHHHPFMAPTSGMKEGTFEAARSGETSSNVWYRIHLEVMDSEGLTSETFVDIHPNTVEVTVETQPAGLQISVDGQPKTTPYTFESVVNYPRVLEAISPQTLNGNIYDFISWSNGATQQQTLDTPAQNASFSATFTPRDSGGEVCEARTGTGYIQAVLGGNVSWTNPIQEPIRLQPNTQYTASMWVKGESSLKMVVQPCWSCANQAVIKVCSATSSWSECSLSFTTGSENLNSYIFMFQDGVNSPVRPAGRVLVDDVFLGKDGVNLLSNFSFESGFDGWSNTGPEYFSAQECSDVGGPPASPTPSPSPTSVASPSPIPSPTPEPTPLPSPEVSPVPSPVVSPSPSPSPTPSPSIVPTPSPSPVPFPSPSPSPEPVVCEARTGMSYGKAVLGSSVTWTNPSQEPLRLQPNTKYTASIWVKGDTTMKLAVQPCWSCGSQAVTKDCKATSEWSECSLEFTTGSSNLNNYIFMLQDKVFNPARPAGTVLFDDAFIGTNGVNLLKNASFETGFTDWTNADSRYYSAEVCSATPSPSPLPSPSPTPTPSPTPVASPSPTPLPSPSPSPSPSPPPQNVCEARTGSKMVKATLGSSVSWTNPSQEPLRLQPNTTYTASLWLKGNTSIRLAVQPCWSCGSQAVTKDCKATSEWSQCSLTFTTGSTNLNNYIFMFQDKVFSPARPAGTVYVDDVFLGSGATNLLQNAGFESNFSNWTNADPRYYAIESCSLAN